MKMTETQPLRDKVILITGAAQGIGATTAKLLAARGATLSLSDVSNGTLGSTIKSLQTEFPDLSCFSQTVDVCQPEQVENWIANTKAQFGKIDGCVNNAGKNAEPRNMAAAKRADSYRCYEQGSVPAC
jgi:NADP-dependent 3-hydroxy acid dehydrogenase YdfG